MYEETAYKEGPKAPSTSAWRDAKAEVMGAVLGAQRGFQRILVKDWLKDDEWGQVQGEKEISLTGFLSCTIDSMEIGGKVSKTGAEGGTWGKGRKGKGRQLMQFICNK